MDDIRRFVQIDDIKRGLYMEARKTLQEGFDHLGYAFVCVELKSAMSLDSDPKSPCWLDFVEAIEQDFNNMFPELIELFDGYMYTPNGEWSPVNVKDAWFGAEMIEARIALIDFILSQ